MLDLSRIYTCETSAEQLNITLGTRRPSNYPFVTNNSDLGRGRLAGGNLGRDQWLVHMEILRIYPWGLSPRSYSMKQ